MSTRRGSFRVVVGIFLLAFAAFSAFAALVPSTAAAQESSATKDAGKHFGRGVALYGEADYRGALVEFTRAYAIAPNIAVLYNVGEAQYQLQDYAGALTTFEKYLADAAPTESRRAEVESDVEVLRARVGRLTITTTPAGADVTIDDQAIGRTPFDKSVLVSIGRRKVIASMPGRPPVARYIDVAAEEDTSIALQLASEETPRADETLQQPVRLPLPLPQTDTGTSSGSGAALRRFGWAVTGASAAGAIASGILAVNASSHLTTARNAYPTSAATLSHDGGLVTTYSILADSLAAAALLVGGVTLYATLSSSSPTADKRGSTGETRVSLGPGSARFEMTF